MVVNSYLTQFDFDTPEAETMFLHQPQETVPLDTDAHGVIRIAGTRVTLHSVACSYFNGCSPEEVVCQFPTLKLDDVYAVFTFMLRNKEAVDAYMLEQDKLFDERRKEIELRFPAAGLRERLLARKQQMRE